MRIAGDGLHGRRLRGLLVVLWHAGLRGSGLCWHAKALCREIPLPPIAKPRRCPLAAPRLAGRRAALAPKRSSAPARVIVATTNASTSRPIQVQNGPLQQPPRCCRRAVGQQASSTEIWSSNTSDR